VTPAALLSELRAAGAALRVVGGRLEAKALPPALAPLARVWAAELRRLLEQPTEPPAPWPSWAQLAPGARLEAPGPELPPDLDPAEPGYPSLPAPVLVPGPAQLEAAELPAHLADTPEAWAAFLDSAPWLGPAERRRILADVQALAGC
jgi:hypothetical protein